MAKHDTSRARLLIAMQQFDVHHRGKFTDLGNFSEKDPWPGASYSGLALHEGRYYPAKVVVHLANPNFDRSSEVTQMAVRILEKHDFEFVHFGERGNNPGTCCWDGFPNSRKFDQCLPFTGEEFWDLLVQRASGSDSDSVFEFKGNKRKIGGIENDGAKIIVYRPPKGGETEWSETPSKIDRGTAISGYSKMLDSEGIRPGGIFSAVKIHNQAIVHLCRDLLEWTEEGEIRIKSVNPIQNTWPGFTQETFDVYQRILDTPKETRGRDYKEIHKPIFEEHLVTPLQGLFNALIPDVMRLDLPFVEFNPARGKSLSKIQISGHYSLKFWACFHHNTAEKKTGSPQFFFTIRPTHFQFGFYRNSVENYSDETRTCVERMAKSEHLSGILAKLAVDFDLAIDAEDASENGEIEIQSVNEWINSLMNPKVEPLIRWRMEPSEVVAKGPELFWDVQSALYKLAPLFHLMEGENPIVDPDEEEIDYVSPESTTLDLIKRRRFVILEGVPGTGKTHIFKEIKKTGYFDCTRFLTFHPSSDYSSFIGGIRPGSEDEKLIFNPTKGHLLNILEEAKEGPVLLWIDELNRANVPRVFGDLISLIGNSEPPELQILNAGLDDDKLELTDEQKKNLHIVATMNTSDRSVTPLDAALRRRFNFVRLQPMDKQELSEINFAFSEKELEQHVGCFLNLNEILRNSMGDDAILGHSYLFEMFEEWVDDNGEWYRIRDQNEILMIWKFSILPNIIDTLMLTQNFEQIDSINEALRDYNIPLSLDTLGHGLGEMILVRGDVNV